MIRNALRRVLTVVLLCGGVLPMLAGCGEERTVILASESEGAAGTDSPYAWPYSDSVATEPDAGPPPEPFSMPFEALVQNRVRWAASWISVLGARIERGMDAPAEDDWYASFDPRPEDIYVEIDISVENAWTSELVLFSRHTWDLILRDGTRISPASGIDAAILPGDTGHLTVRYMVDDVVDLTGAAFELNGEEYGVLEPERIPLDAAYERRYPLRLTEAVGKRFAPIERGWTLAVIDAHCDVNDPNLRGRAEDGHRFVRLDVIGTQMGSYYDSLDDNQFRLVVDGFSYPVNEMSDTEVIASGSSQHAFLNFVIDEGVRTFELAYDAGYDSPQQRIAVDLDNAVLVEE